MDNSESFTLLPIRLDPTSKAVTINTASPPDSRALPEELTTLNTLHRALLTLDTPAPPPPIPVAPKRSANITRLLESGNTEYRRGRHADAIRYYTLGLQMALTRPLWEPSGLVRDEVAGLYSNRAQAHMALQAWPEGLVDAEASVEAKKVGNAKAWWRKGKCLFEMGRTEEAREWVKQGLEIEGSEADLVGLLKTIEAAIGKGSA